MGITKNTIVQAINREMDERRDLTVLKLSEMAEMPPISIYRIMRGQNLSLKTLEKLMRVLNIRFTLEVGGEHINYSYRNPLAPFYAIKKAYGLPKFNTITHKEMASRAAITLPTFNKIFTQENMTINVVDRLFWVFEITLQNNY